MLLKTKDNRLIDLEVLHLAEASHILRPSNPELANLIEKHVFKNDDLCFLAKFPFGAKIIHDKEVFLPLADGGSISFNDPAVPDIIHDHLSYTVDINNPVGIIINKSSEFYTQLGGRIESYQIVSPGQMLGFGSVIDSVNQNNPEEEKTARISDWSLDAGGRLIFMLANISNSRQHTNLLKTYGIDFEKPTDYIEQCLIFRAISQNAKSSWQQEILFFSTKFLQRLKTKRSYQTLYKQFLAIHRSSYTIWHYAIRTWESEFNHVIHATGSNNYSPYAISIAKHLFLIVAGGTTGFAPVTDDQMCPDKLINEAYTTKGYRLSEQWPNLIQAAQFKLKDQQPIYYSPNLSSLSNFNPETFKGKTNIELLDKIHTVVNLCQNYIFTNLKNKNSYLYNTIKNVKFSFYHSNPDPNKFSPKIKNSLLIPEEDRRFHKNGRIFPYLSSFARGCIKIELIS